MVLPTSRTRAMLRQALAASEAWTPSESPWTLPAGLPASASSLLRPGSHRTRRPVQPPGTDPVATEPGNPVRVHQGQFGWREARGGGRTVNDVVAHIGRFLVGTQVHHNGAPATQRPGLVRLNHQG